MSKTSGKRKPADSQRPSVKGKASDAALVRWATDLESIRADMRKAGIL